MITSSPGPYGAPGTYVNPGLYTYGLGTSVTNAKDGREVLEIANLDWKVECRRNYHKGDDGVFRETNDSRVTVRGDTDQQLSTVGNAYEPVQNEELVDLLDFASSEVSFLRAGSLDCGRLVWFLGRLKDSLELPGGDDVVPHVLVTSSHDGRKAITFKAAALRRVSESTMFISQVGRRRHTINCRDDWARLTRGCLKSAIEFFRGFQEDCFTLAGRDMTPAQAGRFLKDLVPDPEGDTNNTRAENKRSSIMDLFEEEDISELRGTQYAMAGAIAEYADHEQTVRRTSRADGTQKSEEEARLESSWFGGASEFKKQGFNALLSWS